MMLLSRTQRFPLILLYFSLITSIAYAQGNEEISISGTLLMLDDKTPHVAVVVQAVTPAADPGDEPTVVATVLSDTQGKYELANLKPGPYQLRCHTWNGYFYRRGGEILRVEIGKRLKDIDFRFAPFRKGTWKTYDYPDGLTNAIVLDMEHDQEGRIWFTTFNGVSRYDGATFVNFTTEDGLMGNRVEAIYRASDGTIWLGGLGGISHYDGKRFTTVLTEEDGLPSDAIFSIIEAADGRMWFGTGDGVARYDGKQYTHFSAEDMGIAVEEGAHTWIMASYQDQDGALWFGAGWGLGKGGGVTRYDGVTFRNFTTADGLAENTVRAIYQDADGVMWFATHGGVSCYDGGRFRHLTTRDGLVHNRAIASKI